MRIPIVIKRAHLKQHIFTAIIYLFQDRPIAKW